MDFNSLPTQYTKNIASLYNGGIITLYDYHPWHGGNNPDIDKITNTLINFKKNDNERARASAVKFFTKVLGSKIEPKLGNERRAFCVVPSHSANTLSKGLLEVISNIQNDFSFVNRENYLVRKSTVAKASTGGNRSVQHHLDSIDITCPVPPNTTVFLFDDVTTTGNSLEACEKILLDNGAEKVVKIAFGQTV